MPARLVPRETIPILATEIDSPAAHLVLRHLRKVGFVVNDSGVSPRTAAILQRLTDLGLVDPGYEGESMERPYMWVENGNGSRVLRYIEASPAIQNELESKIKINHRAHTALSSLPEWEQAEVLAAVDVLRRGDKASWPADDVMPLGEAKQVYLLRASPELRAFVRILDSEEIELFDIVREDTLQLFLERYGAGSRVG